MSSSRWVARQCRHMPRRRRLLTWLPLSSSACQVHEVLDKIRDFSDDIRAGKIRGATGKPIRNIIAVGIGGSYLGPACIHEVFKVCSTTIVYAGLVRGEDPDSGGGEG